jgi:hypothetical protein
VFAWFHRRVLSSWALVCTGVHSVAECSPCCLSGTYLCVCMVPSWVPVIVGTCQRGVRWMLFVGELLLLESCVRELPLYLYGITVNTRQRGVHWVLLVGELPMSEKHVKELPLHCVIMLCCHRGHLLAQCSLCCLSGTYLCQRCTSGSYPCISIVPSWGCVRWVVCQSCSRQGVTFA